MRKRKLWFVVGGIIIVIFIAFFIVLMAIDGIVKGAIEKYGSQYLGTKVTVSSVNLSIFGGDSIISGLSIANPPGYSEPYAIQANRIYLAVNLRSLFSDTVLIKMLDIDKPQIVYQTNLIGSSNLSTLANYSSNLQKQSSSQNRNTSPAIEKKSNSVIIQKLVIHDGKVTGSVAGIIGASLNLPKIEMSDLGKPGHGISFAQATGIVISAIVNSALSLNLDTLQNVGKAVGNTMQNVGKSAGSALQGVGSTAGKAVQGVGSAVGGVINSVFGSGSKNSN